jgi:subtilisin family serine protease/methionine-rich copper-binding protein CopC
MIDKVSSKGSVSHFTIIDKDSKENGAAEWSGVVPLGSLASQSIHQQEIFNDPFIGSFTDRVIPFSGIASFDQHQVSASPDEDSGLQDLAARIVADTKAPKVSSFSPVDGSSNVNVSTNITFTFNEAVKAGSGSIQIRAGSSTGTIVESFDVLSSSHLTFSGNTLTIDPTANLASGTHYYVTLAKGTVIDLAGNSYAGTTSYDFTTVTSDTVAPTVTSFSPSDGSSNIAVNTSITVIFSETVKAGTGSIEIHAGSATGALVESFNVTTGDHLVFSGKTLTIDPVSDLSYGTHYYVTFTSGTVQDLAGNSYAGTTSYDFTTVTSDIAAPTVTSFSPSDGSSDVAVSTNITVTLSETVKAGTGTIEIHAGSATGALVESFDVTSSSHLTFSGNTLTIDPVSDLSYGTHYYVTFASGAVQDLAGNSYTGTTPYDFMTRLADSSWSTVSGHGLLDIDAMLELATGQGISDAPLYGDGFGQKDWGLNDIQAPDAWQAVYTGDGIIVAVVDTGVNYTHSDLAGNIWVNTSEVVGNGIDDDGNGYVDDIYGYDFVNRDGYALDDKGHGTHVAGIIAGLRNGTGVTGVAYDATIMPVKVLDSTGNGSFSNVAAGILYAVNNGADVINLSLGAYGSSSYSVTSAITYALNHGVLVCMAAGNDSQASLTYPAILSKTTGGIAVGAVNSSDTVASFSNDAGSTVPFDYVVAPGVSIYSTYTGSGYAFMSGTSMATPYVAGAAALLLSAEPDFSSDWTLAQLENIVSMSAQSLETSALAGTTGTTSSLAAASLITDMDSDLFLPGILDSVVDSYAEPVELSGIPTGVESGYEVHIV